jgi:hypothetical protein
MLEIVVVEPTVDFIQQFGRRLQVDLGGTDIHVAHIGGQSRKKGVDILTIPIPGQ